MVRYTRLSLVAMLCLLIIACTAEKLWEYTIVMKPMTVKLTGYCNGPPCTNTVHGMTKSGVMAKHGHCAADWLVFGQGTVFNIPDYGICVVRDTGRLVKGKHLDLYFNSLQEAKQFGTRHSKVEIVVGHDIR